MASMIEPRSAPVYGSWRNATSSAESSFSRTNAVEIPSNDVPDMTPTASTLVMISERWRPGE